MDVMRRKNVTVSGDKATFGSMRLASRCAGTHAPPRANGMIRRVFAA
jgi:hypothetical protein